MPSPSVPTSPQQRRRVLTCAGGRRDERTEHCLTAGLRVDGPFDEERLHRALATLTARHPALRSTFPDLDTQVLDGAEPRVVRLVAEGGDPGTRWQAARDIAAEQSSTYFDPAVPVRLQATVIEAGPETHLLVLAVDPLVGDAWSASRLVEELLDQAAPDGATATGDDGYEPVWRARTQWLLGPAGATASRRRRSAVQGALLRWPLGVTGVEPGPPVERYLALPDQTAAAVRELLRRERSTVLAVAVAALALVADDPRAPLALRSTFAARETAAEAAVVGAMANDVVMRVDATGATDAGELLHHVRAELFGCLADQKVPYDLVADVLAPGETSDRSVALVFLPRDLSGGHQRDLAWGAARAGRLAVSVCPTGADVDLFLLEGAPPLRHVAAADLTLGACSWRGDPEPWVLRLLHRWAEALRLLAVAPAGTTVAELRRQLPPLDAVAASVAT